MEYVEQNDKGICIGERKTSQSHDRGILTCIGEGKTSQSHDRGMLTAQVLDRERTSARCVISCQRSRSSPNHCSLELHLAGGAVMTPKCRTLQGVITKGLCHHQPMIIYVIYYLWSYMSPSNYDQVVSREDWGLRTMSIRLTEHVLEAWLTCMNSLKRKVDSFVRKGHCLDMFIPPSNFLKLTSFNLWCHNFRG